MGFNILYITYLLNGLIMVGLPIALTVFLQRHLKQGWRLFWIGAITFVLSQVFHIPFNSLLTRLFQIRILPTPPASWIPYFNPILLGLSAGIFEETARYLAFRFWARDARSWGRGLLLGAGHGGIEAIILGSIFLINFFYLISIRGADLSRIVPLDQLAAAQKAIAAFWSVPWYYSLMGAVERMSALPIHLACSVLVLQVFTRRNLAWLPIAVLWHALVDGLSAYLLPRIGVYWLEATVGLLAVVSVGIIFILRKPEPAESSDVNLEPLPPKTFIPKPVDETLENLQETRYQ